MTTGQRSDQTTCVVGDGKTQEPSPHSGARDVFGGQLRHHGQANGREEQLTGSVKHVQEQQGQ